MNLKLIVISFLFCFITKAQLPNTDIWLFKLQTKKQITTIKTAKNITNREGYDNQPAFNPIGKKIYFTSIKEDKQADIYFYDLGKDKTIQLTKTAESEYSPNPSIDDKLITCVTVLKDSSQIIQALTFDKNAVFVKNNPLFNTDSVGYFTFLNTDTVIYYKLTQPHSLRYHCISTNEDKWLGNNPIRGFKAINRNTLIYGLKDSANITFYKYNFLLHKSEKYGEYNSLNEDIIWHAQWGLLKSEGNKILRYEEVKNEWQILFDLAIYGIKKITRFSFDNKNNYLVAVDNL